MVWRSVKARGARVRVDLDGVEVGLLLAEGLIALAELADGPGGVALDVLGLVGLLVVGAEGEAVIADMDDRGLDGEVGAASGVAVCELRGDVDAVHVGPAGGEDLDGEPGVGVLGVGGGDLEVGAALPGGEEGLKEGLVLDLAVDEEDGPAVGVGVGVALEALKGGVEGHGEGLDEG